MGALWRSRDTNTVEVLKYQTISNQRTNRPANQLTAEVGSRDASWNTLKYMNNNYNQIIIISYNNHIIICPPGAKFSWEEEGTQK